mmetsp:Transcript_15142/g.46202  ORF Transcript_15142/g.46202 Transcript_15142/m.46202 type:complete len:121 (+) Transcript_15142:340-702(+)
MSQRREFALCAAYARRHAVSPSATHCLACGIQARQLVQGRPRLLQARSTTKGYTAMHYAAMAGALPMLEWLAEQGISPEVPSMPADGSAPVTPAQVIPADSCRERTGRVRSITAARDVQA